MTAGMDVLTDLYEIIWTYCNCHDYHTYSNKCTRQGLTLNIIGFNSFLASGDFFLVVAKSLDPDQDGHNVGSDLDQNRLTL